VPLEAADFSLVPLVPTGTIPIGSGHPLLTEGHHVNRRFAVTTGSIAALAVAFLSGASISPGRAKPIEEKKPGDANPATVVGQKTAVFNMAVIMRDFNTAKYQVYLLNKKKNELSVKLTEYRGEYSKIAQELKINPNHPNKEEMIVQMRDFAHKIDDEDGKINKQLNGEASIIISDLYDKMKIVVDATAKQNGFQLVFAYPDAVTPEEMNSAYIKEMKLKPPAAQPFYISPDIDITTSVVKALNEKYPPIDPKTKEVISPAKLEQMYKELPPVPPAPTGSPPAR
jgi:Skp family chaperone for outer membrane proteins